MKRFLATAFVAALLAAPALSFAQSAATPVTRAEVKADLARLEQAGYSPAGDKARYPDQIQAAEARVSAQSDSIASSGASQASQSATPAALNANASLYAHH